MSQSIELEIKSTPATALSQLVFTIVFETKINDKRVPIAVLSNISNKVKTSTQLADGRYYVKVFVKGQAGVAITLTGNGVKLFNAMTIPNERIINEEHSFRVSSD